MAGDSLLYVLSVVLGAFEKPEQQTAGALLLVGIVPAHDVRVELLPERPPVTPPPLAVGHEGEVHVCGNTIAAWNRTTMRAGENIQFK